MKSSSMPDPRNTAAIRVAHVIETLGIGGAERRLVSDLRWLDRTRYEHRLVYLTGADDLRPEIEALGIPVEGLGLRSLRQGPAGLMRLVRLLRQWRPHVVHTQVFGADVYGRLASALSRVPLVLSTVQTVPYSRELARFYSRKRRMADQLTARLCAHQFVAVSDAVRQALVDEFGIPPSRVHVIPNGVDLARFFPSPDERAAIRDGLGYSEDEWLMLTVGRLIPEKNQAALILAYAAAARHLPQARLLVAGDGPLRRELEGLVAEQGLAGRVRFLGTRPDVERLYRAADLFVLPSLREGLPVSLLEAMASEVPVLASAIPQHREVVEEGRTGWFCSPHDSESLAQAIRAVAARPAEAKAMARQARLEVRDRFSAQALAGRLQQLYDGLLAAQGLGVSRHKILRVITRLNIGGPAQQAILLTQALTNHAWTTTLVSGEPSRDEGDLGFRLDPRIRWIRLRGLQRALHPFRDLAVWWRLFRLLCREQPDLLHTHMAKAGALGRAAGLAFNGLQRLRGNRRRLVMMHTFHGHVLSGYFSRWHTRFFTTVERWLARRTDVLIAVSPSVRDDLIRRGIGDPARLHVVPLGLDLSAFLQVEAPSGALRRELGIAPAAPLIGIVGRLAPIKQHDLFLHAAKALLARDPSRRFVIVGDGERRSALEALARRLGLGAAVRFVGWRLDLPAVYADLDCVCLTSRNEGTPVSVIEALACARPVAAAEVGGVPDLLGASVERGDGYVVAQRGLLVQWSAQPHGFVAAVERLLADRALAQRLGQAGRAFVREHLTAERLVRDIEGLYGREEVTVP